MCLYTSKHFTSTDLNATVNKIICIDAYFFEAIDGPVFFFKASTTSIPLELTALFEAISKYTTRDTAANYIK